MPEGHVIHRLARRLNTHFAGQALRVSSPQGRFATEAALIDGRSLRKASAWGKHLFLDFEVASNEAEITEPRHIVHIHLGLIGSFRIEPYDSDSPWGKVRLHLHKAVDDLDQGSGALGGPVDGTEQGDSALGGLVDGIEQDSVGLVQPFNNGSNAGDNTVRARVVIANDLPVAANLRGPQWCRLITEVEMEAEIGKLGADPLRPADPLNLQVRDEMFRRVARSRRTIASLLMDQKFFAGVGNIYRAEVLFRLGINPETRGDVASERKEEIWEDLVRLMAYGEQHGRIDTVREQHQPEAMGRAPREDDHGGEVYVYRRAAQPCLVCGDEVQHAVVEGRNLFWCPKCQR